MSAARDGVQAGDVVGQNEHDVGFLLLRHRGPGSQGQQGKQDPTESFEAIHGLFSVSNYICAKPPTVRGPVVALVEIYQGPLKMALVHPNGNPDSIRIPRRSVLTPIFRMTAYKKVGRRHQTTATGR